MVSAGEFTPVKVMQGHDFMYCSASGGFVDSVPNAILGKPGGVIPE
jgi:hypothetical protein